MFLLYFVPYLAILTETVTHPVLQIISVVIMSIGLSGIGLSVIHDANHGAYSKQKWANTLIGYSLNMVGANAFNWKIQHNVLHHTYTNVHDEDEDISPRGVLRMTPHSAWKPIHRYQYIYAWFLYGLMTIVWMVVKDFARLIKYQKNGLLKKHSGNATKEWIILIATKIIYISYIFILPVLLTDLSWWQVLIGITILHYLAGFMLAIIFQPAHVIDGTAYPLPNEDNMLENNWAIHQLHTTTNFGNDSRWFSWYVGGLNFQIEHHLFPNICHVHYRNIAAIVRKTTIDFGLPYKSCRTFLDALNGHAKLLRSLGRRPTTV
ncbi:fatty acid desaturase family protein [Pseudochryseolinea flava]|nr:acyl-CoA desaturase [Pseudochryseolinea flava]